MNQDKQNEGVLFLNNKKETDNHPDHTGWIDVEGKKYRLVSWDNTAKSGVQYQSVKISEWKEPQTKDVVADVPDDTDEILSQIPF